MLTLKLEVLQLSSSWILRRPLSGLTTAQP